ncbi:hypothetical protein CRYUN_Cryun07bG0152400 [Craigia yunnanensis]
MSYSREGRSVSPGRGRRSRSLSRSRRSRSRSRSRDFQDASNPGNNLYVTGLSTRVTTSELEKYFGNEGKVMECNLVKDPRTRESRGFAFVTMETVEGADRCIKYLNRSVLEGRLITVEKAKRSRGRTPTPGRYQGLQDRRDKVVDGLIATHLDDMIEIIIQGVGKEDHVLVLHMVGEEMIMTHIGGAENTPCLVMAMVIVDERKLRSNLHMVGKEMIMTRIRGAESAPSLVMAVVIIDERKTFSSQSIVQEPSLHLLV